MSAPKFQEIENGDAEDLRLINQPESSESQAYISNIMIGGGPEGDPEGGGQRPVLSRFGGEEGEEQARGGGQSGY